jgi:hypothetical protein
MLLGRRMTMRCDGARQSKKDSTVLPVSDKHLAGEGVNDVTEYMEAGHTTASLLGKMGEWCQAREPEPERDVELV